MPRGVRRISGWVSAACVAASALACATRPTTGYLAILDSQLPLEHVVVRVGSLDGRGGTPAFCRSFSVTRDRAIDLFASPTSLLRFPATLSVEPGASSDRTTPVLVTALAYRGTPPTDEAACAAKDVPDPFVRTDAVVNYVEGSYLELPLPMSLACVGVKCGPGTTCREGTCVDWTNPTTRTRDSATGTVDQVPCYAIDGCDETVELARTGVCSFAMPDVPFDPSSLFVSYDFGDGSYRGAVFLARGEAVLDAPNRRVTISGGLCALAEKGILRKMGIAKCPSLGTEPFCPENGPALDAIGRTLDPTLYGLGTSVDGGDEAARDTGSDGPSGDSGTDATLGDSGIDATVGDGGSDATVTNDGASDATPDVEGDSASDATREGGDAANVPDGGATSDAGDGGGDAESDGGIGPTDGGGSAGDDGGGGATGDCLANCCGYCVNDTCSNTTFDSAGSGGTDMPIVAFDGPATGLPRHTTLVWLPEFGMTIRHAVVGADMANRTLDNLTAAPVAFTGIGRYLATIESLSGQANMYGVVLTHVDEPYERSSPYPLPPDGPYTSWMTSNASNLYMFRRDDFRHTILRRPLDPATAGTELVSQELADSDPASGSIVAVAANDAKVFVSFRKNGSTYDELRVIDATTLVNVTAPRPSGVGGVERELALVAFRNNLLRVLDPVTNPVVLRYGWTGSIYDYDSPVPINDTGAVAVFGFQRVLDGNSALVPFAKNLPNMASEVRAFPMSNSPPTAVTVRSLDTPIERFATTGKCSFVLRKREPGSSIWMLEGIRNVLP
ncbi:MAG: hypothetical protein U0169_25705 [Polyangiaceae bacterium]